MARPRHHLALLLLGLLAGAAATTGADTQAGCDPATLAAHVGRFCALGMPTAPCCAPVLASVDHGGGVPCLLHVAAQPRLVLVGLNASHLLSLYTACGSLRASGFHLASASNGASTSLDGVSIEQSKCKAVQLSSFLAKYCNFKLLQSSRCCRAILTTVDIRGCLCYVAEQGAFLSAEFTIPYIWRRYKNWGGRRQNVPKDTSSCHPAPPSPQPPPPSPPPPPPRPSQPPPSQTGEDPSYEAEAWIISGWVLMAVISAGAVIFIITKKVKYALEVQEPIQHSISLPSAPLAIGADVLASGIAAPLEVTRESDCISESTDDEEDPTLDAQVRDTDEARYRLL